MESRETSPKPADKNPAYKMIDISEKPSTSRTAVAEGIISVKEEAFYLIKENKLPKGNPLVLAEVAGILAAKNAPSTIPLCHPLSLDKVTINIELIEETYSIKVTCTAKSFAKTGVEMEALAGVNGALLAIYDLTKQVEPALNISDIKLLEKIGGKSGHWKHPDFFSKKTDVIAKHSNKKLNDIQFSLITMSDRAHEGIYEDKSGEALKESIISRGGIILQKDILSDCESTLESHLIKLLETKTDVIITTGGTGCGNRDITPEVVETFLTKKIDGIGELLRASGAKFTPYSYLSRSLGGLCKDKLIICLPGSTKAMEQSISCLDTLIPHLIKTARGGNHE